MARPTYERLTAQDSSFIHFEGAGTHMHVSAVAIFELPEAWGGRLEIERLRRFVASRLHRLPRYRRRLETTPLRGHPIWVDDRGFNLEYHVRHTALPGPGNDDQLRQLAGRILSQQLDRSKPLWETWFVEGLERGRFAMISKIHHCMVDGVAGVGIMTSLLSTSPEDDIAEPVPWTPAPAPGRAELVVDELARVAGRPLAALAGLRKALKRPRRTSEALAENAEAMWQALNAGFRVPSNTPLNAPIGTHRRLDWCSFELAAFKDLKKGLDGSVNDVVLAVVAGALRRFLQARGAALDGIGFRIVIPVNARSGDEGPEVANRVSAWFLTLPLGEPDPRRRFERIRDETRRLKDSKAARGIELFTRLADWTDSELLTFWGVRLASSLRPYNLIVTNVSGPQVPLYLLGAKLEMMIPQLPLFQNQGLGVAVMSYLGRICFGLTADWDLVPDLPELTAALPAAFEELQRAGGSSAAPAPGGHPPS
jgi:WS/DGAT/MGAT family acyltransferase